MLVTKQKICLLGDSNVGKSTLLSLLQGKDLNGERKPTIGLEIENSHLNGKKCAIWDLGGQERFKMMWQDFLRGAGLTVVVTDSTEENVQKTKNIVDRFFKHFSARVIAIANKQDLPGALSAKQVEEKLGGIKTYGMTALRPELRARMQQILEYELEAE
ncbi:MAG: ADP-ribosylation factor-like protein [Promethearchaeota archaeon]